MSYIRMRAEDVAKAAEFVIWDIAYRRAQIVNDLAAQEMRRWPIFRAKNWTQAQLRVHSEHYVHFRYANQEDRCIILRELAKHSADGCIEISGRDLHYIEGDL